MMLLCTKGSFLLNLMQHFLLWLSAIDFLNSDGQTDHPSSVVVPDGAEVRGLHVVEMPCVGSQLACHLFSANTQRVRILPTMC